MSIARFYRGGKMKLVTKYAMFALLTTSFIALNNCGNHTGSTEEYSAKDNGPAADYAAILGAPLVGYPIGALPLVEELPLVPVETACFDGVDNDGDGLEDCYDNDCHVHPECSEWGPPLEELENSRAVTVYPNGFIVPEDVVFQKARRTDDDDGPGGPRTRFFSHGQLTDCWIYPREQDPYWYSPMGEALVAGPYGPIGPQLFPQSTIAYFGPRSGLINECEDWADVVFNHWDDDNDWQDVENDDDEDDF
jgi:hypothetical protein